MALLDVREVTVRFGGIIALDQLSFDIEAGQICGLIGPNGAGKTTMFNVVSRIYQPTSGRVLFDGIDLLHRPRLRNRRSSASRRTFQNLALFPSMTLLENVMVGAYSRGTVGFVRAMLRLAPWREERATREFAYELLERLDLAPLAFRPAAGFPFGTLKRLELARALAARPKFLLMDEPASGLTHSEVDELGETVKRIRDEFDADRAARRAPHGDGDGHLRQGRGDGLRPQDRRGHAGRSAQRPARSSRPTWGRRRDARQPDGDGVGRSARGEMA